MLGHRQKHPIELTGGWILSKFFKCCLEVSTRHSGCPVNIELSEDRAKHLEVSIADGWGRAAPILQESTAKGYRKNPTI